MDTSIEVDATTFAVEIERSLALMGEFIQADSSYRVVFDEPARLMHVTEAWYHPDRPSQTPPPEGLPLEAFPWAIATLRQRQPVCVPQVDALPDEQGRDRASWQQLHIQAVLSVPLVEQGTVMGFLGFLSFSQPMVWEDDLIQLLTVFAQTIASTQERLHAEQAQRLSEAQNRAILTTLPDLIVCVGADGRYRELYNPGHSLDLCPPGLDRVGKHVTEVLPAGIAARQLQVLAQVLATGEAQVYEQVIWVGDRWQYEEVRAVKSHPEEVLFLIRDISDRKQAEQQLQDLNQRLEGKVATRTAALQASEAQMRALVAAIPDLLLRVRWAGQHLEYTQPWVQAHQTQAQLLRPGEGGVERLEEKRRAVEQAMTSGELQVYEQQLNLGDRHRYEEVRVVGIDAQEALMIVRDITGRKQAEQENQRLRDRLEYLLNESPALIYSCRVSGDYGATYMSENVRTILGYEPAQFTTESSFWADHLHPEDAPRVFANLAALWERGYHCQEYRFLHRDGHYLWLRDEVRLLRDEHGNPLEIVGSRVDIDDRKRAEQALQESETRFRRVFDSNVVGMIFTDFSGQISDANDYFLEMLGYERADLATGRLNWATLTPPEYRAQDEQVIAHLRQQGSIAPWDQVYIHQDGHWVWVLVGVAMLAQDEGTCVCVVVDISDRQQAEAQLQRTNAELSRATRLKDEFLANMSHELRTPLNAILGLTEGLQEEIFGPLHDPQRLALSTIERSGSHLLALINDILDVAKIESGHLQLNLAPTAIAPLCQSSLAFVKQQAQKKQIQLTLEVPPDLPELLVDERRLRQVLINLLTNAVKFTPDHGQVTLSVSVATTDTPRHNQPVVRFAVQDTGIGIPPAQIQNLFQPFVQIDSALNRQYQGTGLGLALVKQLTELHGGQVGFTSTVGVGSCFTVDLPYNPKPTAAPQPIHAGNPALLAPALARETAPLILLAEDHEANITTLTSYLTAKGFRVCLARDGKAAVAAAQDQRPDLILMDIQMPGMDGLEAIRQIRRTPAGAAVPILALTALAMGGDRDRCLAAGATDYLSKPVRLKHLVLTMQQLLASAAPAPQSPSP